MRRETPLERALRTQYDINYCDECENCVVVNGAGFCRVSGKILHPIMFDHGLQGNGPALHCKVRLNEKKGCDE